VARTAHVHEPRLAFADLLLVAGKRIRFRNVACACQRNRSGPHAEHRCEEDCSDLLVHLLHILFSLVCPNVCSSCVGGEARTLPCARLVSASTVVSATYRVNATTMLPNSRLCASSRPKPGTPPNAWTMYCLPLCSNVIGPALAAVPRRLVNRTLPLVASTTVKSPPWVV